MKSAAAYQTIWSSELDTMSPVETSLVYGQDTAAYVQLALEAMGGGLYAPYIVCSTMEGTGQERRLDVVQQFNVKLDYSNVLYNRPEMSCFVVSLEPAELGNVNINNATISYQPLTPFMKMRGGMVNNTVAVDPNDDRLQRMEITLCPHETIDNISMELQRLYAYFTFFNGLSPEEYIEEAIKLFPFASTEMVEGLINDGSLSSDTELTKWYQAATECFEDATGAFDSIEIESSEEHNTAAIIFPANAVSSSCALSAAMALTAHTSICSVERSLPMEISNVQAQWISQSGINNVRPWFAEGLDGSGEVITVSDSGLDTDNCYFWDASAGEKLDGTLQMERRKVVQYFPYMDMHDDYSGHGTVR